MVYRTTNLEDIRARYCPGARLEDFLHAWNRVAEAARVDPDKLEPTAVFQELFPRRWYLPDPPFRFDSLVSELAADTKSEPDRPLIKVIDIVSFWALNRRP